MPDSRLAPSFISTAKRLIPKGAKRPTQANLRRSVSTAYYAVFHALAKTVADSLVGSKKLTRPNKAWVEAYRGLGHGNCKDACTRAQKIEFPQEILDFSDSFIQLQEARHHADYNPMIRYTKEEARLYIALAEKSIATLKGVSARDKKAFATWVLITSPGATQARKWVRDNQHTGM